MTPGTFGLDEADIPDVNEAAAFKLKRAVRDGKNFSFAELGTLQVVNPDEGICFFRGFLGKGPRAEEQGDEEEQRFHVFRFRCLLAGGNTQRGLSRSHKEGPRRLYKVK